MILKIILYIITIILVTLIFVSSLNLSNRKYNNLVEEGYDQITVTNELITEDDISHLPTLIQSYLNYVGVVGTEKVYSYQLDLTGDFRMDSDSEFQPITAKQTSYSETSVRLFYMTMKSKGIKLVGLHHYINDVATMDIRVFDLVNVVHEQGDIMNQSETVTILNDIVLFAPQILIDDRFSFTVLDDLSAIVEFDNNGIVVEGTIYFNDKYQIVDFISEDRYASSNGTSELVTWSTPITEYQNINNLNLPKTGLAKWIYDDSEFIYINLNIENIEYNK